MSRRILIVENEPEIQEVLSAILELSECQCEIERANNGAIALEILLNATENSAPDLIFLDLMMPEMDGMAFVHEMRMRNLFVDTPIIVISGDTHVREQVNDLGMDIFIGKPFTVNEILDAVNGILGEPSSV